MKAVVFTSILFVSSCSAIPTCSTKSIKIQLPSSVPFIGNDPFELTRTNDHVDCELDPDERNPGG